MNRNLSRGRTCPIVKRYNIDIADSRTFPDVIIRLLLKLQNIWYNYWKNGRG